MSEIFKKHFLEILLFFLIFVTIFIRSLKNPNPAIKTKRSVIMRILDSLGSVFIGCSVGISIYIGSLYFTDNQYNYLGFLVGYLVGSLGEKFINVIDLKIGDILIKAVNSYLDRFKK